MKNILTLLLFTFLFEATAQQATAPNQTLILNAVKNNSVISINNSYSYGTISLTLTGSGAGYAAGDVIDGLKTVTITGAGGHFIEILDAVSLMNTASANTTAYAFFGTAPTGTLTDNTIYALTYSTSVGYRGTCAIVTNINGTGAFIGYNALNSNQIKRTFFIDNDVCYILPILLTGTTVNTLSVRLTYRIIR